MNDSGASTNTNAFDFSAVKTGIESVLGVFTANLTVANIASVLGIVVVACLTLYLFYWGARKVLQCYKVRSLDMVSMYSN